jgi:hypothetical protein
MFPDLRGYVDIPGRNYGVVYNVFFTTLGFDPPRLKTDAVLAAVCL